MSVWTIYSSVNLQVQNIQFCKTFSFMYVTVNVLEAI